MSLTHGEKTAVKITSVVVGIIVLSSAGGMYGCPQYNVYSSRLAGEAELAQASYSRQVRVQESQAKLDAAKLDAQTDTVRAGGVAAANKIIAEGLGGPEGYLRWKYIEMLEETASSPRQTVIYVPTEGNIPILEAEKRP